VTRGEEILPLKKLKKGEKEVCSSDMSEKVTKEEGRKEYGLLAHSTKGERGGGRENSILRPARLADGKKEGRKKGMQPVILNEGERKGDGR